MNRTDSHLIFPEILIRSIIYRSILLYLEKKNIS